MTIDDLPKSLKTPADAEAFIRLCVRKIGWGYHPDTRAAQYRPPLSLYVCSKLDALHERAFELLGKEVYTVGEDEQQKLPRKERP